MELKSLKEAEQEFEIQTLKRRIFELESLMKIMERSMTPNAPSEIYVTAELPKVLYLVARLDTRITSSGGCEIIGRTIGGAVKTDWKDYHAGYYVERAHEFSIRDRMERLVELHRLFVLNMARELRN